jgi:hypothetical protein
MAVVLSFPLFLIDFCFLTDRFAVKVQKSKKLSRAARDILYLPWKHCNALGQGGCS